MVHLGKKDIAIAEKDAIFETARIYAVKAQTDDISSIIALEKDPDNLYGIRLYEALGMHRDGILRQNYKAERGYLDQIIYSLLRSEYFSDRSQGNV